MNITNFNSSFLIKISRKLCFIGVFLLLILNANAQYNPVGNAFLTGANCFTVTNNAITQSGAVWYNSLIDLSLPFDVTITLNFGGSDAGADGMAFVLQNQNTGTYTGGGGMGYMGFPGNSLGVIMDDYQNSGSPYYDPIFDHISISKNGDVYHNSTNELTPYTSAFNFPSNIEDGLDHLFRFAWNPTTQTINVYFGTGSPSVLPATPTTTYTGDIITSVFGGNSWVYWGVTAATGAAYNLQTVCFTFIANYTPSASSICSGQTVTFTDNSVFSGTVSYLWDFGDGTTSTLQNPTHVFTNPGSNPIQRAVKLTITQGTASTFITKNITVNPLPQINAMSATATCSGSPFSVTPNSTNGIVPTGTTYTWTAPIGTGISGGLLNSVGTSPITGTLTNSTNIVQNATCTVTPTSANACIGNTFTLTIPVNPKPLIPLQNKTVCSGVTFTVTPLDNQPTTIVPAGTTYSWGAPSGNVTGGMGGSGSSITGNLVNNTGTPQIVTYNVTPSSTLGPCTGTAFQLLVTVNPVSAINTIYDTLCSGSPFTVTPTNGTNGVVQAGTKYTWPIPVVTGSMTGGAIGTNATNISGTLYNPTNLVQTATYTVTPTTGLGCTGANFSVIVTVNPTPNVPNASNPTKTLCSGDTINQLIFNGVNGNIIPVGTTYSWPAPIITTPGSITGGASGSGTSIHGKLINTTNTVKTGFYIVTPTSPAGCVGDTFTLTITLNPTPAIKPKSLIICSGTSFTFTPLNVIDSIVPTGTTYSWTAAPVSNPVGAITGGSAQTTSTAAPITQILTNVTNSPATATYSIIPKAGSCPGNPFTLTVTVNPAPSITAMTDTICSGDAFLVTPQNDTNGIVPTNPVTMYSWTTPVSTPVGAITGGLAQATSIAAPISQTLTNGTNSSAFLTYTITPKAGNCIGATFPLKVIVNPLPAVTSSHTGIVCSGIAQNYTITSNVPGTTYVWSRAYVNGINNPLVSNQISNPITEILTNTTSASIPVVYLITPTANGCTGNQFIYTVTVNPTPIVNSSPTGTVCSGVAQNYQITSSVTGSTFNWSRISVPGITNPPASNMATNPITEILNNDTSVSIDVQYQITPTANGCAGVPFTYTVTVKPSPTVNSSATGIVCSGLAQNYQITSNVSGATFIWSRAAVAGISNPAVTNQVANPITETLTVITALPVNAVYIITPSANGCTGPAFNYTVTVEPAPTVSSSPTGTICSGVAQSYLITSATSGTTFKWSRAVVPGISNPVAIDQVTNPITEILNNVTPSAVNAIYQITPLSNGCTGILFNYTVTINPVPALKDTTITFCSAFPFTVPLVNGTNGVVLSGTTYTWGAPTGLNTGGAASNGYQANISGTLTNQSNGSQTSTYIVTPKSGAGCVGDTFSVYILVNPAPLITDMKDSICSGIPFSDQPAAGINGTVPAGTTYTWSTPVITPVGAILGGSVQATPLAIISQTLTNVTNAPATAKYTVTPAPISGVSCPGSTFTLTIKVFPKPAITAMTSSAYSGSLFNVTPLNVLNGIVPAGTTYSWGVPNVDSGLSGEAAGSGLNIHGIDTNLTSTPLNAYYTVTPTTANNCVGDTFSVIVNINPALSVLPMNDSICSGNAFTKTPQDVVDGTVPPGTTYTWGPPAGSPQGGTSGSGTSITGTLTNLTNTPQNAVYTVMPSVGAYQGAAFTLTIKVNPASSITPMTAIACSGTAFTVTPADNTNGTVLPNTTYAWSAPTINPLASITGGSAQATSQTSISQMLTNITNVPATATYSVLPTTGSCVGAPFTVTVTVNPVPSITAMNTVQCSGLLFTTTPVNITNGTVPAGTTYSWPVPVITPAGSITGGVAGNGSNITGTLTNITSTADTAIYTLTPTAYGCTGANFTVTVVINPVSFITTVSNDTVCSGSPFSITPTSPINGIILSGTVYSWPLPVAPGLSGGQTSNGTQTGLLGTLTNTNPIYTGFHVATYIVTPKTNGCAGDTFIFKVVVKPAFHIIKYDTICKGGSVTLGGVIYTTPGAYTDNMTTVLGCDSVVTIVLTVNDTFNIQTNPSICEGDTVKVGSHAYTTTGLYTDHLQTVAGCDSTVITNLTVHQKPVISINVSKDTICTGDTAILTASGGDTYIWSPNGETINPLNATPLVTTLYSVIGSNTFGCKDSANVSVVVYPKPLINPTSDITDGCEPKTINFTAATGALTYFWTFGDGDTSALMSPSHNYALSGTYPVSLTVKALGCILTFTPATITIYSQPHAEFTWAPPIIGTLGVPVNFTDETTPLFSYTYTWNFGDSSPADISKDPAHTFNNVGSFTVNMIVIGDHGCSDTAKHTIQIVDDSLIFPNVMTPNGDGFNDKFEIKGLDKGAYTNKVLYIYNRWGKKVYESNNYQNDFDGGGLPDGVYYVVFTAKGILKDVKYQNSLEILR